MMKRNSLRSAKAKSGTKTPPAPKADQSRAAQMQTNQTLEARMRAARKASMRQSSKDSSTNARNLEQAHEAQKRAMAQSQKAKSGTRIPPAPREQIRELEAQKRAKAAAGSKSRFNSKQEDALKKFNSKISSSPVRATPRPMKEAPPKPKSGTTKPMGRSLFFSNAAKTLRGKK